MRKRAWVAFLLPFALAAVALASSDRNALRVAVVVLAAAAAVVAANTVALLQVTRDCTDLDRQISEALDMAVAKVGELEESHRVAVKFAEELSVVLTDALTVIVGVSPEVSRALISRADDALARLAEHHPEAAR